MSHASAGGPAEFFPDPRVRWRCPTCDAEAALDRSGGRPRLRCGYAHEFGEIDGVLCLCEPGGYADSFGPQWITYGRTQVDKFNGTTISRDRFFEYTGWPRDLTGETVLEAGSGCGRFTQVLLDAGATVVSFDYSAAVVANQHNNGGHERLTLFRGDIYRIPLAPACFDRVVCLGVLQHTPDPRGAFHALAKMLKPGGFLAVDIYRVGLAQLASPKHVLRVFRRFMPAERAAVVARRVIPWLLRAKASLRRIPVLGVPLAHLILPVADYRGRLSLSDAQAVEWAELEFIDAITPAHDHPATRRQVERWCQEAGLVDVAIEVVSKGGQFAIRGRRASPP